MVTNEREMTNEELRTAWDLALEGMSRYLKKEHIPDDLREHLNELLRWGNGLHARSVVQEDKVKLLREDLDSAYRIVAKARRDVKTLLETARKMSEIPDIGVAFEHRE